MRIEVYNNDVAKAYRILQKKLNNEGIPKKLKEKEYYISKGEQRLLAKKRGIARYKKAEKKRKIAMEKAEARAFKRNRQISQQNRAKYQSGPKKSNKNLKRPQK